MFDFLKKIIQKKSKPPQKPKKVQAKAQKPAPQKPKKVQAKAQKPAPQKPKKVQAKAQKPAPQKPSFFGLSEKLKEGLAKTRETLNTQFIDLFSSKKIDNSFYDELEMILLTADVGISATSMLIEKTKETVKKDKITDPLELKEILKAHLVELLKKIELPLDIKGSSPFVMMVVGVNGAGKTTTIGKLTKLFQSQSKKVLIAAGDTFRAAAVEQLSVWGERNNAQVIAQQNGDPSAVIFDAVNSAKSKNLDIVLADTAGRLPTQKNLIDEITKIKRVIGKCHSEAPQEVMLVIDANTGQNAINQLQIFNDALNVTGLIITKLDGTAKGGIVAAIAKDHPTPLRFVGVGEKIDDLRVFNAKDYVEAMIK
ncbi:MAG: signal recognition particle-docking protein FtsY [Nitrosomonadales bacterium]|jgi:fused signal recognition particle receptor|nr:signal recognition particle-docking protein FtsY [Nitrosomonadales bacterium]MBT4570656.1 signal recognition particle-docking protein FtsY [Nitrosomonadales bacterium]MBT6014388.1 signal recognition particle-docking protein FtsY [Nitrosomonadales bacterium]